jgi:hypothetical protein
MANNSDRMGWGEGGFVTAFVAVLRKGRDWGVGYIGEGVT